jgi:hypothetical protein
MVVAEEVGGSNEEIFIHSSLQIMRCKSSGEMEHVWLYKQDAMCRTRASPMHGMISPMQTRVVPSTSPQTPRRSSNASMSFLLVPTTVSVYDVSVTLSHDMDKYRRQRREGPLSKFFTRLVVTDETLRISRLLHS